MATMRWGEKRKTATPSDMRYSVECYFERALRFRSEDNVVRMIYATFLSRNGRHEESVQQIDVVASRAGDNAFTHYNAGLLYAELKQYDKALQQAHAAMALGFTRVELREQLKAAGKWSEPVQVPDPAASAASAAKSS
jgi:tetratricopeptide (TPR) repeat protein